MVAERKRVSRLGSKEPAHPKVSPFRPTIKKKGGRVSSQKIVRLFSARINGLLKPTGNVGQQAHHNAKLKAGQFHFLMLKLLLLK